MADHPSHHPIGNSEDSVKKVRRHRSRWRRPFLVTIAGLVLVGGVLTGYAFYYSSRYLPRTVVGGVAVGGKTQTEAAAAVHAREKTFLTTSLTLHYQTKSWQLAPQDLGTGLAVDSALKDAWNADKQGSWQYQLKRLFAAPFWTRHIDLALTTLTGDGEKNFQKKVLADIETAPTETSISFVPGKVVTVPGKAGLEVDRNAFEESLDHLFQQGGQDVTLALVNFAPQLTSEQAEVARTQADALLDDTWTITLGDQPQTVPAKTVATWLDTKIVRDSSGTAQSLQLTVKTDVLQAAVKGWAGSYDQNAQNAQLGVQNNQVVVTAAGTNGRQVDQDQTVQALQTALLGYQSGGSRTVAAVTETVQPAVRQDTLASLGLTQRIATATTDYTGSPTNRTANIALGQKKLNGTLVLAGGVYSTLDSLGPITPEAGFLPELVIKDNRTVPDTGGGLCQVSTTLFRAVLNAGLPVVERQNHSYRVSYYEKDVGPGLDATIYSPSPDFKWKNDLGSAVLVQSYIQGNTITFELYGTSDGRVAEIDKPVILEETPAGDPIYVQTDTLAVGVQQQIEHPHPGAKTSVTYIVRRNGQEIYRKVFLSTYKPWPAQYLVGTKQP